MYHRAQWFSLVCSLQLRWNREFLSAITWEMMGWKTPKYFKLNIWHNQWAFPNILLENSSQGISHNFYSEVHAWKSLFSVEMFFYTLEDTVQSWTWHTSALVLLLKLLTIIIWWDLNFIIVHFHTHFPQSTCVLILFLLASYCWWMAKRLVLS